MSIRRVILFCTGLSLVAGAEEPLTLDQALALAMAHNERAQKAPLRVAVAEGSLDKARTAFYPTIAGQATGAWNSVADKAGRDLSANGQLTINQPLVNPSSFLLYGQARHALASERFGATEDLRVLGFDTTNAFVTAIASESLLAAAKHRLDRAKSDRDDLSARATAGLASSNDVTRADLAVATAAGQVASAVGSVERAYLSLGYLVGQPVKGPLVAPERTTNDAQHRTWNIDEVVHRAEGRRPDVLSAAEHTLALEDFAKEPLYRLAPTLSASANVRELFNPLPSDNVTTATAQLNLVWTIYDAGVRYTDRRIRVAQAESGSLDERALRRTVATDIATAIASLHASREVFRISVEAIANAAKNVDETAFLYSKGLAKAIEVTDANASRFDAEVTGAQAKLSMEQAYLNLRYALGLGPVADELPNPEHPAKDAR